jgi:2-amino-4-hydroxy-6-hydroxymethyldihydropteridine diphosphokinase
LKDQNNIQAEALIGIGSNINPAENIQLAIILLSKALVITDMASIWQTPAVGSQGPDFLNTAILIANPPPLETLKNEVLHGVESSLGRVRTKNKNADRPIDLDVLVYQGKCLDTDLWEKPHVTIPAAELLPFYSNHLTGDTLNDLAGQYSEGTNFILRDDLVGHLKSQLNST